MSFDIDLLDQRMGAAALFLASLQNGDIQVPDATVDQARAADNALHQYGQQLALIRRNAGNSANPSEYLAQTNVAYLLAQMDELASTVLKEQQILLDAAADGLVTIVSREELDQDSGSSLAFN